MTSPGQQVLKLDVSEAVERSRCEVDPAVLRFCRWRWRSGKRDFYAGELLAYVASQPEAKRCAPDTPRRRLNELQTQGQVRYELPEGKGGGVYRLTWVRLEEP